MIQIDKALQIPGWMSYDELTWLALQASKHSLIVELGSYAGRSTRALADNTSGRVIAIDDWKGCRKEGDKNLMDDDKLYPAFEANLKDVIQEGKVVPIVCDHDDLAIVSAIPDMVFIDGDHSYQAVRRDIQWWLPKIREGGIISGHDSGYDDVKQALSEFVPGAIFVKGTTIWYKVIE